MRQEGGDCLKKEGLHPLRRRHPRGAHLRAPRQGAGAAVRGADQDQAGQLRGRGHRQARWSTSTSASYLEEHPRVARAIIEKAVSAARAREAARKARDLVRKKSALENARAARQAGRLLARRPGALRDLPGRGRLGRRQRQAGPRPLVPGHPAAPRQDPERGAGPDRQDPLQRGNPRDHHRHRHRRAARTSSWRTRATTRSSS